MEKDMALTEVKHFTVKEAERTLPLVKQIVRDILNNAFAIKYLSDSFGNRSEESGVIEELAGQISSYVRELEEIGCNYKDWNFQVGLIDFPAIIDEEEVLLCWRTDEPGIRYFHGPDEGFVGRRPIPEEYLV
jgi:hypothetical protein